ncbi:lipopolysaccharide export system permease protein [Sphingomonas jejuensis]|uniref:Lipopolysaccharide export system permease protein n=2 Tax=Sphingomonas jejuensis TaxID=904715 RepID=A0ABX0XLI5_9SPHN|nr:lipopolysaccharide export system permease protein [Sphingomonas jejuensis]
MTSFFPSRTVSIYMARLFLVRSLAVLGGLVLILMALDLLGESGRILAQPGNGQAEVVRYVFLRIPQIVDRFLPFAILLGTLITLATLNQNSEVISLKASGMSAHQILAPLVLASLGVALFAFVFHERIVTRSNAALTAWQAARYGPVPDGSGSLSNVWARDGNDLVFATAVAGRGADTRLTGVTLYQRGTNGGMEQIIEAEAARPAPNGTGWLLTNASLFEVQSGTERAIGSAVVATGVRPDQFTLARVDADALPFTQLSTAIEDLEEAGRPTNEVRTGWWHKFSGPLSSVLMPFLGAVAGFGLARSGKLLVRSVIGMALGFTYFVADNFALAMGNLGAYPPFLAAWAPFVLFFLIGQTVLFRTEE